VKASVSVTIDVECPRCCQRGNFIYCDSRYTK